MSEPLEALNARGWSDFSFSKEPRCPHCGEELNIADNDAWFLYDESETHEIECPSCNLEFLVNSQADWRFSTDEQEPTP